MKATLTAQKEDISRLLSHNQQLANIPQPQRSITPIHVSEEEEDVQFLKDTELIDPVQAQAMLTALQFESMVVEPEEYDESELNDLTLTL